MHGDLHPANLLVECGELNGVIDFGLPGVGDPVLEAVEREGDDQLHAGGIDTLDGTAVDLVGTGALQLLEHVRLDGGALMDGATRAQDYPAPKLRGRAVGGLWCFRCHESEPDTFHKVVTAVRTEYLM